MEELEHEREELNSFQEEMDRYVQSFVSLRGLWNFLTNERNVHSHRDGGFQFPFSGLESRWNSLGKLCESRRMENDEKLDDLEDIQELDARLRESLGHFSSSVNVLQAVCSEAKVIGMFSVVIGSFAWY